MTKDEYWERKEQKRKEEERKIWEKAVNALKAMYDELVKAGPTGFPSVMWRDEIDKDDIPSVPLFTDSPIASIKLSISHPWGG